MRHYHYSVAQTTDPVIDGLAGTPGSGPLRPAAAEVFAGFPGFPGLRE